MTFFPSTTFHHTATAAFSTTAVEAPRPASLRIGGGEKSIGGGETARGRESSRPRQPLDIQQRSGYRNALEGDGTVCSSSESCDSLA